MNLQDSKYRRFNLVKEMLETPQVVRRIDWSQTDRAAEALQGIEGRLLLSGEGSSRIFPAKRAITETLRRGSRRSAITEGATQALKYDLRGGAACIASNSGKTKEGLRLVRKLKNEGILTVGIVANAGTPIVEEADHGIVLSCGEEKAVAATKSVVEQTLIYQRLFSLLNGYRMPDIDALSRALEEVLTQEAPADLVRAVTSADSLLWAGRNDGVAEELTLKTNEITRKRSDFLEGTYAVHGIEEVLTPGDTVILVDPFEEEEEKFRQVLVDGVGLTVVAIASRETSFPTLKIPSLQGYNEYLQLAAGWSLLVEAGIKLGIDLDKPVRARKVGNEATE